MMFKKLILIIALLFLTGCYTQFRYTYDINYSENKPKYDFYSWEGSEDAKHIFDWRVTKQTPNPTPIVLNNTKPKKAKTEIKIYYRDYFVRDWYSDYYFNKETRWFKNPYPPTRWNLWYNRYDPLNLTFYSLRGYSGRHYNYGFWHHHSYSWPYYNTLVILSSTNKNTKVIRTTNQNTSKHLGGPRKYGISTSTGRSMLDVRKKSPNRSYNPPTRTVKVPRGSTNVGRSTGRTVKPPSSSGTRSTGRSTGRSTSSKKTRTKC